MDSVKKTSMLVLSLVTILGGLLLFAPFFQIDLLEGLGNNALFVQGLVGVLVIAYGLIGFRWFLGIKNNAVLPP